MGRRGGDERRHSWLTHCTTSQRVAGPIPNNVFGIFRWHNPSDRALFLGSTQLLTEISTRNISWRVKAAGAWGWQTYDLHVPIVLKSVSLNFLKPPRVVIGLTGIALLYRFNRTNCALIYRLCNSGTVRYTVLGPSLRSIIWTSLLSGLCNQNRFPLKIKEDAGRRGIRRHFDDDVGAGRYKSLCITRIGYIV